MLGGDFTVIREAEIQFNDKIPRASGSSALVRFGRWREHDVAVKRLHGALFTRPRLMQGMLRELRIMHRLRACPNVAYLHGVVMDGESPESLVMSWYAHGSLYDVLHVSRVRLSLKQRVAIGLGFAKGLHALHSRNVLHRDIKSKNVLIDENLVPHLADFGLSKDCTDLDASHTVGPIGSIRYMAPELFGYRPYSSECDIFSAGVLLWEIIGGQRPFQALSVAEVGKAITDGKRPGCKNLANSGIVKVLEACWHPEPRERVSALNLVCQLEACIYAMESPQIIGVKRQRSATSSVVAKDGHERKANDADVWRRRALAGDTHAMYALVQCFVHGKFVDVSPPEAFAWCQKAALKGHVDAMWDLRQCYLRGYGVQRSQAEANRCFFACLSKNHPEALYAHAVCMEHEGKPDVAEVYYAKTDRKRFDVGDTSKLRYLADLGDVRAQRLLGDGLFYGIDCRLDREEAMDYYARACANEDLYSRARCRAIDGQRNRALDWLKALMSIHNTAAVEREIGLLLVEGSDEGKKEEGWGLLEHAAEKGDAVAQMRLAYHLWDTQKKRSISWMRKAAESRLAEALFNYGWILILRDDSRRGHQLINESGIQVSMERLNVSCTLNMWLFS